MFSPLYLDHHRYKNYHVYLPALGAAPHAIIYVVSYYKHNEIRTREPSCLVVIYGLRLHVVINRPKIMLPPILYGVDLSVTSLRVIKAKRLALKFFRKLHIAAEPRCEEQTRNNEPPTINRTFIISRYQCNQMVHYDFISFIRLIVTKKHSKFPPNLVETVVRCTDN